MSETLNTNSSNGVNLKPYSIENLEKQRFAVLVVLLLIVGCLGGVSVGVGALLQTPSLIIIALTTMAALSMMLSVAPMKAIIYTSAIAIIADIIIILVNLLS